VTPRDRSTTGKSPRALQARPAIALSPLGWKYLMHAPRRDSPTRQLCAAARSLPLLCVPRVWRQGKEWLGRGAYNERPVVAVLSIQRQGVVGQHVDDRPVFWRAKLGLAAAPFPGDGKCSVLSNLAKPRAMERQKDTRHSTPGSGMKRALEMQCRSAARVRDRSRARRRGTGERQSGC
jgi:hypothetical protein